MRESKNLLELRSQRPVTPEAAEQLHEILKPLLESTNSELLITDPSMAATLHPSAQVVATVERLCTAIEGIVEVNQALLAYMIDLDGGAPESEMGQSLDG